MIDNHVWWSIDWLCFIGVGRRVFARTAADTVASMAPGNTRMRNLNGVLRWARVQLAQTQRFQKSNDRHSHMNHWLIVLGFVILWLQFCMGKSLGPSFTYMYLGSQFWFILWIYSVIVFLISLTKAKLHVLGHCFPVLIKVFHLYQTYLYLRQIMN